MLALAGFSTVAFSQIRDRGTELGVNVGYNASTVTIGNSGENNSDYRSGLNLAVTADNYFSDRWSLKIRAAYDQKGWANGYIDLGDGNGAYTTDYKLNYLTVPVLASWHFGRTRNWYLHFGPYVGVLLNAQESAGGNDIKDLFNTTDVGLDLGIGVKFPVSPKAKFFIEADGQGGFGDIVKDNQDASLRTERSSINVGFTFSLD